MKHTVIVDDDRLRLRPLREKDLPQLVEWLRDPDVWEHLGSERDFSKKITLENETQIFQKNLRDESTIVFAIEAGDGLNFIGTAGLRRVNMRNKRSSVTVIIGDKREWNKGYGTEALRLLCRYGFTELGLHRISLTVDERHEAGKRCYQKCGFTAEGVLRECVREPDGSYHSNVVMSLLEHEWHRLQRGA
jgi:RimJ/RimL family protein N-acetyltransferase